MLRRSHARLLRRRNGANGSVRVRVQLCLQVRSGKCLSRRVQSAGAGERCHRHIRRRRRVFCTCFTRAKSARARWVAGLLTKAPPEQRVFVCSVESSIRASRILRLSTRARLLSARRDEPAALPGHTQKKRPIVVMHAVHAITLFVAWTRLNTLSSSFSFSAIRALPAASPSRSSMWLARGQRRCSVLKRSALYSGDEYRNEEFRSVDTDALECCNDRACRFL